MGYSFAGKCSYSGVPRAPFDIEVYRDLTPTECKLLFFLYEAMHARSAPCIRVSLAQLREYLGMDAKTIRTAREGLARKNLIRCDRAAKAGSTYELHVVNPETGERFPPETGRAEVADYVPRKSKAAGIRTHCRAAKGIRRPQASTARPQPAQAKSTRDDALAASPEVDSEFQPVCRLHPNAKGYWDNRSNRMCCPICEPSPYAPQSDYFTSTEKHPPEVVSGIPCHKIFK